MTKADIVEQVYEQAGLPKKESGEVVERVFGALKEAIANGEKVKLSGFGNFEVRTKASRIGRNLKTGEAIEISARRVLTFKPSQLLRAALNVRRAELMADGTSEEVSSTNRPAAAASPKTTAKTGTPKDIS